MPGYFVFVVNPDHEDFPRLGVVGLRLPVYNGRAICAGAANIDHYSI